MRNIALILVLLFAWVCCGEFTIEHTKASGRPFAITAHEARSVTSETLEQVKVTPLTETERALRYDVTVYCADWCGPCETVKRRDGKGDEEIRLTYKNERPPRGIHESYPTYVWTDAKGHLRYVQGAHELPKLLNIIERKRNDPPSRGAK